MSPARPPEGANSLSEGRRAAPRVPMSAAWLTPSWTATGVGAVMSTRQGGFSVAPWGELNLGEHVGDDPEAVAANRALFKARIGAAPVYLRQVHGARLVRVGARDARPGAATHEADASLTTEAGVACTVLVADCLPVLIAAPGGRAVAAAHAGWRGLSSGVIDVAVAGLCEAASCDPAQLSVWLGACIGSQRFEVGADVLRAFGASPDGPDARRFQPVSPGTSAPKWLANLALLARDRVAGLGVTQISGENLCTVQDPLRFYSYRRDGVTGRMAAAVWIR
jgi:polyphenol oxidase